MDHSPSFLAAQLTDAQRRGLSVLITFISANGMPPTAEELAKDLGYRKRASAIYLLKVLERKGFVDVLPSTARGIRVLRDVEGQRVTFGIVSRECAA